MRYRVTHRTDYAYPELISLGYSETRMSPRNREGQQQVLRHRLDIDPRPDYISEREDYFGNRVLHFAIQRPHRQLAVTAITELDVSGADDLLPLDSGMSWEQSVNALANDWSQVGLDARQYLLESPLVKPIPELADYARQSFPAGRPLQECVRELMERIHQGFTYDPAATTLATPLSAVFRERRGVCQDFAHLGIACLRSMGLAARYVSGYLETLPPPGKEKLVGSDASHAWFAVYHPVIGWLDYDPTNNLIPMSQHITTAWGRDYADVSPIKGVIFGGGSKHDAKVSVDVERLD